MTGVSRYQLTRTIASGGMAHVYEAVAKGERGFERRVAIKRVLPQLASDPSMQRMFLDEARIASHLHHVNIVQVLDYGVVDGTEFLVMEYVDGIDAGRATTLAKQQARRMPEPLALHIVAEIAHALAYAHARSDTQGAPLRIVHRDVSPANILLSWDGGVKLSDFGIALASQREEKTATGIVKGKLAYMAPEQAAGERVTGAADVFSLGATLHALLGGPVAGGAPTDATEISPEVKELVQACMAPVAGERPSPEAVSFRAGQLAARAFDRDARGALAEWVAPLRGATPKVSALDDLMGLALVALGDGRSFTVARPQGGAAALSVALPGASTAADAAAGAGAADVAVAGSVSRAPTTPAGLRRAAAAEEPAEAPARERTEPVILPTRRVGPWVAGVAVLVGVAVVAGALLSSRGLPAGAAPAPVPAPSPQLPSARELAQVQPPAVSPTDRAVDAVRVATEVTPRDVPSPVRPTGRDRRRPVVPPRDPGHDSPPAIEVPSPTPTPVQPPVVAVAPRSAGFVRIPRGSAGQERVEIDGRASGFTPAVLELATGSHRFVIRSASTSELLLDRTLTLATEHTRSAPLVVAH